MRLLGSTSCALLLLFAAGCGNVILDAASGGAPGAGGAGGVAVVAGAGGAAGFGGSGSVGVGATSASSTGAGGSSSSCGATYFQLVVIDAAGNDMVVSLTSSCTSDTPPAPVPFAYLTEGGPIDNPGTLTLEGCTSASPMSQGIVLTLTGAIAPGTYPLGSGGLTYTDANGATTSEGVGGTLVISEFQPPGGLVVGELHAKVVDASHGVALDAKFAVCRLKDENVP